MTLSRRGFIAGAGALALAGCQSQQPIGYQPVAAPVRQPVPIPEHYRQMYAALPNERFPVPAVDLRPIDPLYWRQVVDDPTGARPGTIVVHPDSRFLYLVQDGGRAIRYGIGVGREGFDWSGEAVIPFKREWPTWTPPAEMIAREPELEKYRNGMEPGLENPLGARALYLFQNGVDTLYRLHGTNEPWSIGRAVSSGCVRLLNQDVIDLHDRVPNGSRCIVLPQGAPVAV